MNATDKVTFVSNRIAEFIWCSFLFIEAEHDCYEKKSNIWSKLVAHIKDGKSSDLDQALKVI